MEKLRERLREEPGGKEEEEGMQRSRSFPNCRRHTKQPVSRDIARGRVRVCLI